MINNKIMKLKNSILPIVLGLACIALLTACSPDKPENEKTNKLHEDPTMCVFTLTEGSLRSDVSFNSMPQEADFVPTNNVQKIIWQVEKGENFKIGEEGLSKFVVKSIKTNPNVVYSLRIDYYNAKGNSMNNQFFENEQDKIHQHFFMYYTNNGAHNVLVKNREELPYEYTYADSYKGKFIGESNPMGFFGFIRFLQPDTKFDLKVALMHSGNLTKFGTDGKASPFWAPSPAQLNKALWDLSVKLPIEVKD